MKKVTLKKVRIDYAMDEKELTPKGAPEFLDYRLTIMGLLKTPKDPQAGCSWDETATAMPIWKKFRELEMPAIGDGTILLEDAEHKFVTECVCENARYVQRSFELWEMGQSLKDAPEHLVEAKKEA